ncbi:MAG: carbohydrate kinase family protein [Bacteroidales bacterium]|nr:carbohydrate kinase family protein [Bacteroidales bacterium]
MGTKKYDAVIAGYTCVDMLPGFKKTDNFKSLNDILIPGKLIEIDGMDFVLGGLVPNTGLAMKKFGKKVFLNGLTGDDSIGIIAEANLNKNGAAEGIQKTKSSGTAFSIVLAPPGIDRIFLESPGCNRIFDMSHIDFEAVANSKLFHFGYPPLLRQFYLNDGQQMAEMYSKVQNMGVLTSLDFSLPDPDSESGKVNWPKIMGNILPFIDIFVPSIEEVIQIMMPGKYAEINSLSGEKDFIDVVSIEIVREIGEKIINAGVKILLIKMGHRGAYLITGDISGINKTDSINLNLATWNYQEILCDAYLVDNSKFVNASGAGDSAAAAFLTALLNGEEPDMAIKYAGMAGKENLYCLDIYSELSDWNRLTAKIEKEDVDLTFFN